MSRSSSLGAIAQRLGLLSDAGIKRPNPKRRRGFAKRRLLAQALEDRRLLAADAADQVRFVLTARELESDELLPNTQDVSVMATDSEQVLDYQVPIGEVFKLELAAQDLRGRADASGIFRVITDIVVESKGVLQPAIGEVQEITFAGEMVNQTSGTVELFLESDPGNKISYSMSQFLGGRDSDVAETVADAIVQLNPAIDSPDQIRVRVYGDDKGSPTNPDERSYNVDIIYNDPSLVGLDLPALQARVFYGGSEQAVRNEQFEPFINGEINPARMYQFFDLISRNVVNSTSGQNVQVYGTNRVIAHYDASDPNFDLFDNVGALGPVSSQGISSRIPNFDSSVAYDVLSIPVFGTAITNDVVVRLKAPDESAPSGGGEEGDRTGDGVLIYGTVQDDEQVVDDNIYFGGNSRFTIDIIEPPPFVSGGDSSLSFVEDGQAQTVDLASLVSADPGVLSYSIDTNPSLGVATIDGSVLTYTPSENASGVETFRYRVTHESGEFDRGTIEVDISSVNDPPQAEDDLLSVDEDQVLQVSAIDLLTNDTDVDQDDTKTIVSVGTAQSGSVSFNAGQITYTPSDHFFGDDFFTYTMQDSSSVQSTATVHVTVDPINDPPVAVGENDGTDPGQPLRFSIADLLSNDSVGPLEPNQTLSLVSFGSPVQSGSTVVQDGDFLVYTPAAGFIGQDSFTYIISDDAPGGTELTAEATVTIDVSFAVQAVALELSPNQANDITIRKDGSWLEIRDNNTSTNLVRRPLNTVTGLTITGAADHADRVHLDHRGGVIQFTSGTSLIEVHAGNSAGDELRISGGQNANASLRELNASTPSIIDGLSATIQANGINALQHVTGFESVAVDTINQINIPAGGVLDVGAADLSFDSQAAVNLGTQTRVDGGTLRSTQRLILGAGDTLVAAGVIDAEVDAQSNSTITATGELTLGLATSNNGVEIDGDLVVGAHPVTLLDLGAVAISGGVVLGNGTDEGVLRSDSGVQLASGALVSGQGTVIVGATADQSLTNNGTIQGDSTTELIRIDGYLVGSGSLSHVQVGGLWDSGQTTNSVFQGHLTLISSAILPIQIGGTTPGSSHDRLRFSPSASLGGTLDVSLVGNFVARAGHVFEIITTTGDLAGQFDAVNLPALTEGLKWETIQSSNSLHLEVVLDGAALPDEVNVEIQNGELVIRGQNQQIIPISGNTLTLNVEQGQTFQSTGNWQVSSHENVDGVHYQIVTNENATLRISGSNWTNFIDRFDVNGSGNVSAQDALDVINELNSPRFSTGDNAPLFDINSISNFLGKYFDVSQDGRASALDALQIINRLFELDQTNGEEIMPLASPAAASSPEDEVLDLIATDALAGLNPSQSAAEAEDSVFAAWEDTGVSPAIQTSTTAGDSEPGDAEVGFDGIQLLSDNS